MLKLIKDWWGVPVALGYVIVASWYGQRWYLNHPVTPSKDDVHTSFAITGRKVNSVLAGMLFPIVMPIEYGMSLAE